MDVNKTNKQYEETFTCNARWFWFRDGGQWWNHKWHNFRMICLIKWKHNLVWQSEKCNNDTASYWCMLRSQPKLALSPLPLWKPMEQLNSRQTGQAAPTWRSLYFRKWHQQINPRLNSTHPTFQFFPIRKRKVLLKPKCRGNKIDGHV